MRTRLRQRLAELEQSGLLRNDATSVVARAEAAAARLGQPLLDAATNDYLGWSRLPLESAGAGGAGASRLVHGTHHEHRRLEQELASWLRSETALLFSSGYAANVGALGALARPGDLIVSDELNHASIIDGCRLSRASVVVYPHLDLTAAAAALQRPCTGQRWLVTESYFSMDGDGPDLAIARATADGAGAALYVDEAHACGLFAASGAGRAAEQGVVADVTVVTFGKAFGLQGAAVAGSHELRSWLYNRARSFVYSTAPSPALTSALRCRLSRIISAEAERAKLRQVIRDFWAGIGELSQVNPKRALLGPIAPIVLGEVERAMAAVDVFAECGILVQAIRPPTVAPGTARLRLTLKASFSAEDVARLVSVTRQACAV